MRLIIQRVNSAAVIINNNPYSSIQAGLLCFVGFCANDTGLDFEWSSNKILNMKLFDNTRSIQDVDGELLIVSQFTLFASVKKGNKPSWSRAAKPEIARQMYDNFIQILTSKTKQKIQMGVFGSNMDIRLINDGPVTIIIDTKNKE